QDNLRPGSGVRLSVPDRLQRQDMCYALSSLLDFMYVPRIVLFNRTGLEVPVSQSCSWAIGYSLCNPVRISISSLLAARSRSRTEGSGRISASNWASASIHSL